MTVLQEGDNLTIILSHFSLIITFVFECTMFLNVRERKNVRLMSTDCCLMCVLSFNVTILMCVLSLGEEEVRKKEEMSKVSIKITE